MKTIRVKVTRRDIDNGKPRDMDSCPIAKAIHRCRFRKAEVDNSVIHLRGYYSDGDPLPMPETAKRFVKQFDAGKPVKPFAFTLRIP